jgi:Anti-sigma regulatory factor (Ser/Thr protein kinase)
MNTSGSPFRLVSGRGCTVIETKSIALSEVFDSELAVSAVRELASSAGFCQVCEFMTATAASELATNILRYAGCGTITVSLVKRKTQDTEGIELLACDEGPGIPDIGMALREQYSSQENSLGLGLPSVKNMMDDFFIESFVGLGTRVLVYKWKKNCRQPELIV